MLQKFEIHGVHMTVDERLHKYVTKKIGGLDHYLSRHSRDSAHAEVYLKESAKKQIEHATCEVTLRLPHETIVIKEKALNMYAAVDIVEAKLKQQLKKYKDLHGSGKLHRKLMAKFRRQGS
ncbi:MAG TPA: ribosome-associated translation inhibitor RaiA [Candidatus Saccharimonadales bacterium]|nr:ribosome-associated translation inhibitor RaiA [Candidatus Saccharimonadales bacterium]